LKRVRNTYSQSLLKKEDRLVNVKDAFRITDRSKVEGKAMFLVDDILTTGTTLNECSRVLKEAGRKRLWSLSLRREEGKLGTIKLYK